MRGTRRIGSVVVTALVTAGLTVVAGSPGSAAAATVAAPPQPPPAPATPLAPVSRPTAPSDHTDPTWLNPRVTLPSAASLDVAVPGKGRVHAGAMPVEVGRATSGISPANVHVRMLGQDEVTASGGQFLGFELTRSDGGAIPGYVTVTLDYSGIAKAYGGDYAARLRVIRPQPCGTEPGCPLVVVTSSNDLAAQRLTLEVPVRPDPAAALTLFENVVTAPQPDSGFGPQAAPEPDAATDAVTAPSAGAPTVFAVQASASGASGDYSASTVSGAENWNVGLGSGAFTYGYPLTMPPPIGGAAPALALQYNSQSVDGRTTASNGQPGQVGEGWSFEPGYIERRFHSCTDENANANPDLCWSPSNEYFLHFGGQSGELIKNGASNEWRLRGSDPAFRVLSYTGSANGDNDGEVFVVMTPDGTKYWFGSGTEPRPSGVTRPDTNAAYTVPVIAGVNEPCYNAVAALSWCQQAYRWNLDRILDPNDNVTSFFYTKELNYYQRQNTASTQYVRAGYLDRVEYGKRSGSESATAAAKVTIDAQLRCTLQTNMCPAPASATTTQYPDVPLDQLCTSSVACTQRAPTFWTTTEIKGVTTWIQGGTSGNFSAVRTYTMAYTFPPSGESGVSASLWLQSITQKGQYGTPDVTLPPVTFGGTPLQNRVNGGSGGVPYMYKYRIWYIDTEIGARVNVTYGMPHDCGTTTPAFNNNPTDCYPALADGDWVPFRKYLVTSLRTEMTGGQPDQRVDYQYLDTPAWHYQDSILAGTKQSWNDFRGYASVRVTADPGGTTARHRTDYLLFRGMNGDKLTATTAKSYSLTDSFNNSFTDHHFLAGFPLEARTIALDGSAVDSTLHRYWAVQTLNGPDNFQSHDTQYVRESSLIRRIKNTTTESSWITRQTDTAYSSFSGMPTQTTELGDTSDATDDFCIVLTYTNNSATDTSSPNNTEWFVALPHTSITRDGSCSTAPVIAKSETSFDLHALGATPTAGNPTRVVAYSAATTTSVTNTTFDPYGRVTSVQAPNGGSTTTTYSPLTGWPTGGVEITDPVGNAVTTDLNRAWGTPASVTDANLNTTVITSDALGRTVSVARPGDAAGYPSVKFEYDLSSSVPSKITTSRLLTGTSYVSSFDYLDGLGRTIQTQDPGPNGESTSRRVRMTRYDAQGRKAAESQPMAVANAAGSGVHSPALTAIPAETRYGYDSVGRPSVATQYANGVAQWSTTTAWYGPFSRTTPPVSEHHPVDTYTDVFGRTSRLIEYPTNAPSPPPQTPGIPTIVTTYDYTALGDLALIIDAANNHTTYAYDWLHRRVSSVDPDQGSSSSTYDANGNVVTVTDALNKSVRFAYDDADRKTDTYVGGVGGALLAHWAYDTAPGGHGLLASATQYDGGNAYSTAVTAYDTRGRVTGKSVTVPMTETGVGGTYAYGYTYDSADNVRSVTLPAAGGLPAETVTTGFNAAGLPVSLTGADQYLGTTTYRGDGHLAARTLGSGTATLRQYEYSDPAQRLTRINTTSAGVTAEDLTYTYDDDGNVTAVSDATAGTTYIPQRECFGYDHLNRLTHAFTTSTACDIAQHAFGSDPYDLAYTYDDLGNITKATSSVTGTALDTNYTYGVTGHAHAAASVGSGTYQYDANGATTARPGSTLTWDDMHQLASITGTGASTFVYGTDGVRLLRRTGNTTTLYLDGMEVTGTTTNGVTTTAATRYYGNVAMRSATGPAAVVLLLRNNQNSATTTITSTGSIVHQRYTPYGMRRGSGTLPGTTHGFLDKTEDPTGLVAAGARYYDPAIARFVSADPLADPSTPQTLNGYSYALANPTSMVDPSGLSAVVGDGVGGGDNECVKVPGACSQKYTQTIQQQALARLAYMAPGYSAVHTRDTSLVLGGAGGTLSGARLVNAADSRAIQDELMQDTADFAKQVVTYMKWGMIAYGAVAAAYIAIETAPVWVPALISRIGARTEQVGEKSAEDAVVVTSDAAAVGASRVAQVLSELGDDVVAVGLKVITPYGNTDIDVVTKSGQYIEVGGPAKGLKLAQFGQQLQRVAWYAGEQGGTAIFRYAQGTSEAAIKLAEKYFGAGNARPI
jgi:RHS repeat-associated protein